jgi:hypothetical protein
VLHPKQDRQSWRHLVDGGWEGTVSVL